MSPRGKAKAKPETEENGKERRVRESRNVKAASYKDLSDSEEERPARRKRKDSEEEFLSEEEKPKRKVTKGRRASARSKKVDSESEEASDATEGSSEDESRKKRKMAPRKTTRSLRAPQKTSYKDLSDSEEDSNEDEDLESASEEEEVSSKPSGKQKRGRGRPSKATKKDESSDTDGDSKKDRIAESDDADSNSGPADSTDNGKAKIVTAEKNAADSTVSKKDRPEHEMSEDNESDAEDQEEASSKKRVRPIKEKDEEEEDKDKEEDEGEDNDEPLAKKAKVADKPALNKAGTDYSSINFSSDAKNKNGDPWNFKISSWNIAGLRALIKKNGLDFIKHENPDILCLQETKCSEKKLPPEAKVDGYHTYWLSGEKDGYAGVALLSKTKPTDVKYGIDNPDFDTEGRVITAEYDKFFLVNVYVVNAGQGLKTLPKRLEWDTLFRAYLKKLDEQKPVILCGDLNVAHSEIDLKNPKTNVKNAGFTPQERDGMTQLLKEGFVDTFRNMYPDKTGAYTFWTFMGNARSRNVGWRLDYFITSERFLPHVCDNIIRSEVYGSDHCPITLLLNL